MTDDREMKSAGNSAGANAAGGKHAAVKPAGIKDIAKALGISIGTVDRALHARPGVNAGTRASVLQMAEKLGYRPNQAARALKLNRQLRIGVLLPQEIASYYDVLAAGVMSAAASSGNSVEVQLLRHRGLGDGDYEALQATLVDGFDGLLLVPGDSVRLNPLIREHTKRGTPVVCISTDAPRSERLASVTVDAFVSGAVAAELLACALPEGGPVSVFTGQLTTHEHAEKLGGFAATLATLAPHLTLLPTVEAHEDEKAAYEQTLGLLERNPNLKGIYINTANSIPVLRALGEMKLLETVRVVTTDLFAELVPYLESGKIMATLYQRPFTQGKDALEALARYLLEGIRPSRDMRYAPHIILRSNLPLFLDRVMETGTG